MTEEIRNRLPKLGETEGQEDPIVQVKFFTPDAGWTWWALEFDGEDLFFGLVHGFEKELGYFNLSELKSHKGPLGIGIERDKWFKPCKLSEIKHNS